jgi:coenzyme F420-0:L-glutamate ligase/coenzyme F420-1:gamma-L-glutamate ligase
MARAIEIIGIHGVPDVKPGDDLATLLVAALAHQKIDLHPTDVLVVTQKIVSKAEGRIVELANVEPSPFARTVARRTGKDAHLVELILRNTVRVVRMDRGVLIVETPQGLVCANAGVDQSNVGRGRATLLPDDPDASAERLRREIERRTGIDVGVIISDTFGRPWRNGLVEVAIGVSGLCPLADYRGCRDKFGYTLRATVIAVADELAAAAGLVVGKIHDVPAALIRGWDRRIESGTARPLLRRPEEDLFR